MRILRTQREPGAPAPTTAPCCGRRPTRCRGAELTDLAWSSRAVPPSTQATRSTASRWPSRRCARRWSGADALVADAGVQWRDAGPAQERARLGVAARTRRTLLRQAGRRHGRVHRPLRRRWDRPTRAGCSSGSAPRARPRASRRLGGSTPSPRRDAGRPAQQEALADLPRRSPPWWRCRRGAVAPRARGPGPRRALGGPAAPGPARVRSPPERPEHGPAAGYDRAVDAHEAAICAAPKDLVDRAYAEPLDVVALARHAHVSPGALQPPLQGGVRRDARTSYVLTRRVERAQELLRNTDLSVTDICLEVGFQSLGSFSSPSAASPG